MSRTLVFLLGGLVGFATAFLLMFIYSALVLGGDKDE